jgi:hypothetical protein
MASSVRSIVALLGLAACVPTASRTTSGAAPIPRPAITWPSVRTTTDTIAPGLIHHAFVVDSAPWVVQLLEVDRNACWTLVQQKAGGVAVGRATTGELVRSAGAGARAGVNADFFSFTPPGVPTGAAIHGGRVITGPGTRPVIAIDRDGAPWIGVLETAGSASAGSDTLLIGGWNRSAPDGVAWFDAGWGETIPPDTTRRSVRVVLGAGGVPQQVDSSGVALTIPRDGGVLVVAGGASAAQREVARRLAARPEVTVRLTLLPFMPREAAGGFPVLVRDSVEVEGLDAAGGANFGPVRHPRTIVGLAANGRRILLVVVDGRQPGVSAGMTLRESAALMRALGAREAINLDGGGSSAMVLREPDGTMRLLNTPSDAGGERAVANALVALRCAQGDSASLRSG